MRRGGRNRLGPRAGLLLGHGAGPRPKAESPPSITLLSLDEAPGLDFLVNPAALEQLVRGVVHDLGKVALLGGNAVILRTELNLGLEQLDGIVISVLRVERSMAKAWTMPASSASLISGYDWYSVKLGVQLKPLSSIICSTSCCVVEPVNTPWSGRPGLP